LPRTDRSQTLDELLAHIDELISPVSIEHALVQERAQLALFRQRLVNTLIDLDMAPATGICVADDNGKIVIRTKNRRAAELLLRVLEHHADHHRLGTAR
jgi:hypothetical protein